MISSGFFLCIGKDISIHFCAAYESFLYKTILCPFLFFDLPFFLKRFRMTFSYSFLRVGKTASIRGSKGAAPPPLRLCFKARFVLSFEAFEAPFVLPFEAQSSLSKPSKNPSCLRRFHPLFEAFETFILTFEAFLPSAPSPPSLAPPPSTLQLRRLRSGAEGTRDPAPGAVYQVIHLFISINPDL